MKYTVLIGSQARGDSDSRSDVDLVCIGEPQSVAIKSLELKYGAPANCIRYDEIRFLKHYQQGSLFLQHCFSEGRLLEGNDMSWNRLGAEFKVKTDFRDEIARCINNARFLRHPGIFGGRFLSPLVTAFTLCKNAAIFFLAEHGRYTFNKYQCIREAAELSGFKDALMVYQLRAFYDYSIREQDAHFPHELDERRESIESLSRAIDFLTGIKNNVY